MKQIVVGKITKPQGIKGEVKLACYVDNPAGFGHIRQVVVGDRPYRVLRARHVGSDVFLSLEGVCDRNEAEALRDKEVFVERKDADSLRTGDYFICDLVGLSVADDKGTALGRVVDVLQYGAADIFDIRLGDKQFLVPFLKRLVLSIDVAAGTMLVDSAVWGEVCCEN